MVQITTHRGRGNYCWTATCQCGHTTPWGYASEAAAKAVCADHTCPSEGQRLNELRRSNAAGPHGDRRDRRVRTRSAARSAAIRDYS